MDEKEIEKIKDKLNENKDAKSVEYYKELEFLKEDKQHYEFKVEDLFVVEKTVKKEGKEETAYEIYNKKGERIATADEQGNIEFTEQYKGKLEKMPKELYDKIGFDKRNAKVKELEKKKEEKEYEKNKDTKDDKKEEKDKDTEADKESEDEKDNKDEQKEEEVPENEEEKREKMEEDLGIDEKDIQSSSEIKDERFYQLVPEARDCKGYVSIVYIGSKNEFQIIGVNLQTNKYEPLQTVTASQAVEQNSSIDVGRDGKNVERKSLKAVLTIKGEAEYSFAAKLENMDPIELKELRKDFNTGEYISSDLETTHQYPVTEEIEQFRNEAENPDIIEEVRKFKKKEEAVNGDIVTNIKEIKDDDQKTLDDKEQERKEKIDNKKQEKQRALEEDEEEYQKSIYEKPPRTPYRNY